MIDCYSIDPNNGFCSKTKIYHSLLPPLPPHFLPPQTTPLSISHYISSLFHHQTTSPPPPQPPPLALIDAATGDHLSYTDLFQQVQTLTFSLKTQVGLSKGDTAFILSPTSLQIPILYLSLLSLGVIISPTNPTNTVSEISHQLTLSKPTVAFATSDTARKLTLRRGSTILLDSPEFQSMMMSNTIPNGRSRSRSMKLDSVVPVSQSDMAAILYSSGTTGRVKGVMYTHRNLISAVSGILSERGTSSSASAAAVFYSPVPFFHVYGFIGCLKSLAMGETLVNTTGRFDFKSMLRGVEEYKVTHLAVAPPVVVGMAKGVEVEMISGGFDLRSLEEVLCGGAPLAMDVIVKFRERFPNVSLQQGYGLTESAGRVAGTVGPMEGRPIGTVGKLTANLQAKIVHPDTGAALPPWKQGELLIRGSLVMKGYVGDEEATTATLDSDGWLRTGDLCYMDDNGFLFVIDRLKELIKYKGYQVPPAELEQLLQSHPDIVDAAVIPYPNEETGQVPMAFVVRRPESSMNESQVMDFIAKQVAPYKKVRRVAFVDAIPRNVGGKILRKELVMLALSKPNAKL